MSERYIVDLPIHPASADVAGAPAQMIEHYVRSVGRPEGIASYTTNSPLSGDGWQGIETAQKDGTEVLLWLGAPWSKVEKARWYEPWRNWQCGTIPADPIREEMHGIGSAVPTHWRPLPAPPRDEVK